MSLPLKAFLLLSSFGFASYIQAQVKGCKDPAATNYNPAAILNDGSCVYSTTSYVPVVKVDPLSATLTETSGLQWAAGFLWTFNDGGGAAAIYKIDTLSNAIWQTVYLEGATNIDWEDMAFDGTHFYIGDIGNNSNGNRTDLKIYKFPLSAIPGHINQPVVTVPSGAIEVIQFSYADQTTPILPAGANNTSYDCEAMLVSGGAIHLFTKDWINKTTTHYRINSTMPGSYSAAPIETLATNYLVTGADKVMDKDVVVLLGYSNVGLATHYLHLLSDYSSSKFFDGNKRKINLPNVLVMGQAEGISFRNQTYGYISNERFDNIITVEPKLRSFNISELIPLYVLPIQLKNFTVSEVQGAHRIAWQFEKKVPSLTIEYSSDGTRFTDLISFSNTITGNTTHTPTGETSFYRLKWKDDDGQTVYSKIIMMQTAISTAISQLILKANGELRFTINGNNGHEFGFKLTSPEGKLLAQRQPEYFASGRQAIPFNITSSKGTVLVVTVYDTKDSKSFLLPVQ